MANSYYSIRIDTAAHSHEDTKAALLDYYGAWADPSNLGGVIFDYDTSPYLIFRVAGLSSKMIRVYHYVAPRWSYGDAVTGNDVTNAVNFCGTRADGAISVNHLVLGPNTLLSCALLTSVVSRVAIIGKLSNDDFAVLCSVGNTNATYRQGATGYNVTDAVELHESSFSEAFDSTAGKLYTQKLILYNYVNGDVELEGGGDPASFIDIRNISYQPGVNAVTIGPTFIITPSMLYHAVGDGMRTGMYMAFTAP